ncbi:FAD-binding protein [Sphingomonadales bacterium 56]|uniref:oxidoreductase n=1 Tax=unclassified Sphingobium TaxID=2611147 RepID=UPI00191B43CD|nr:MULTISPECIES: FAD-dependent oxidoreductase [unclassified Sphingobium]MBY2929860.1 FAD-binding protein [Sphingomonadales bacterium 56]MBY2960726.1 FAD-binding protein [Sphingomonadales bacterium 58]
MASNSLQHLLSPGRIGGMELRNRIAVTAMGASLAEADGHCGERIIRYHEEQAKGGVGLIITGVAGVAWPVGGNQVNQIAISDDRFLPGLKALAEAVHKHGAKIAPQIHHGGLVAMEDMLGGRPVWCPSLPEAPEGDFTEAFLLEELAVAPFSKIQAVSFKEMTLEDIRTVIGQFAAAADRAKRAGFDGVEIHGGHGYLLSSFISPKSNRRTDAYGGPLENRVRILVEVIQAVRQAVGPDFPVWCKLDSREVGKKGGLTIEDAAQVARMAEAAGADAITVTAYHDTAQGKLHSGSHTPHEPAVNLPYAAQIKAAVSIPVIASGRIEPDVGDKAIATRQIDFVSMGRKLLADPHLPRKLTEGRAADVLPCIYCYTCISAIYVCDPLRCAVNPETGFEYLRSEAPSSAPKRIVVIGGGPGGMEAARRLDGLGHQVILLEQGEYLGGTLRFAALAYPANERLLDWLQRQIASSQVDVRLRTPATPELLRTLQPDAVVVATGAVRGMPDIPGNDLAHVFSGDDMRRMVLGQSSDELKRKTGLLTRAATKLGSMTGMTANLDFVRKATHQWMPLGKRVVIIGGELVGLELAEFLNERGREVIVVDDAPRLGAGLTIVRRMRLLGELKEHGVDLHAGASAIRIERDAIRFMDKDGAEQSAAADHVIVAKGATGDLTLANQLEEQGFTVHVVGDAKGVGYIEGAMRGAAEAVDAIAG